MKNQYVSKFIAIFAAVLVFTFFDWLTHSASPYLSVPSWYFSNKIIFGTVIAYITSLIFAKRTLLSQAALITFITVTLLQIRYYLIGYAWWFHAIVYPEHLFFLFIATYLALRMLKKFTQQKRSRNK